MASKFDIRNIIATRIRLVITLLTLNLQGVLVSFMLDSATYAGAFHINAECALYTPIGQSIAIHLTTVAFEIIAKSRLMELK